MQCDTWPPRPGNSTPSAKAVLCSPESVGAQLTSLARRERSSKDSGIALDVVALLGFVAYRIRMRKKWKTLKCQIVESIRGIPRTQQPKPPNRPRGEPFSK